MSSVDTLPPINQLTEKTFPGYRQHRREAVSDAAQNALLMLVSPEALITQAKTLGGKRPVLNSTMKQFLSTPWGYQNAFPERTVHLNWDKANSPRWVFEAAGDIFREFAKDFRDANYIWSKMRRVQRFVTDHLQNKIHPDDSLNQARRYEPDKLKTLIQQYEKQPVETEAQHAAKELILSVLKGRFDESEYLLRKIEMKLPEWTTP